MTRSKVIMITIVICVSPSSMLRAKGNNLEEAAAQRTYKMLLGMNYTDYITTKGHGRVGGHAGAYRKQRLGPSAALEFGISYTTMKTALLNKNILSDDGFTLWTSDVLGSLHFIQVNSMMNYTMVNKNPMYLSSLIGVGYSINLRYGTGIKNKSQVSGDVSFTKYDYRYDIDSYPPMLANKGYVLHAGIEIGINSYVLDLLYSYSLFDTTRATHLLPLGDGEKLHSLNLTIGIRI